ncbi:MAG: trypsin-like protein serine protease DegP-like [Bacteroidetes bacterium]|nr:MAG: trypsin-like protein serine protease DegP-like [Bacteroidota bacterium]
MKTKIILLVLFCTYIFPFPDLFAQSDIESARTSVVKVKTQYSVKNKAGKIEKKAGTATGFCWQQSMHVVTALHSVAGVDEIKIIRNDGKTTTAKIISVLLEADLALLRLDADLGLKPLALADVSPNAGKSYTIWGFPHAVYKILDTEVRLSRSLEASPVLNDIIHGDDLKYQLEKQKYPSTNARILKIASPIQPGQSGAPLLTSDGKVIGVADGGLRGGTALLNWGMPAAYYVPKLHNSQDLIPRTVSLQSSLYSSSTTIVEDATEEEVFMAIQQEAESNTVSMGEHSITKTWTASYNDIIGTMAEEDKAVINAIMTEFNLDMRDTWYDIYEDFGTGATISIPYGEYFAVQNGWYYTCNADASICYYVLPFDAQTYQNAKDQAVGLFDKYFPSNIWVADPESEDAFYEDDVNYEASLTFDRNAADGSGFKLQYTVDIIGKDMLFAYIIYNSNNLQYDGFVKQFFHFSLAMEMRDFAFDY